MSDWKEAILGDFISVKSGFSYKGKFIGNGKSVLLGMGCVSNNEKFLFTGARPYSGECTETHLANPGDLVLATRQQSDNLPILGLPAIVPKELANKKVIIGTNLYKVLNTSDISNKFIYWLLRWPEYYNHILSSAKGSTVRMITKDAVESFKFLCPSKKERDKIEELLNSLDDKIDLLHQNNKTLEQLAETLYRKWFVEKSSQIEKTISEISKITSGKGLNRTKFLEKGTYPIYGANGIIGWTDSFTSNDNIIITGRVGTLGAVKILDDKCWISDNVLIIKPNSELYKYPIYFSMKGYDFESLNVGSTQPLLTQSELNKQLVLILDNDQLLSCKIYFDELYNKIKLNLNQIQQLETLRDTLLPKLMSGVVRVEN
jgi:type I restriction enzyme S subunit